MTIRWSARARSDIRQLQEYIAKDSPYYARQFIGKIFGAVENLVDHPKMGRQVPEAGRDDVRELVFQGYRVIYSIKRDSVYIVTVVHGSRDLTRGDIKPWDVVSGTIAREPVRLPFGLRGETVMAHINPPLNPPPAGCPNNRCDGPAHRDFFGMLKNDSRLSLVAGIPAASRSSSSA